MYFWTFGGHSIKILKKLNNNGKLISLDKNPLSKLYADKILDKRFFFINKNFKFLYKILIRKNIFKIDGLIIDLGISFIQIFNNIKGFSFQFDSILDMRINNKGLSAAEILLLFKKKKISKIIYKYGEEKFFYKISKSIINYRLIKPILTTLILSFIINKTIKKNNFKNYKKNFSTKTFQAIRIFLNKEIKNLFFFLKKNYKKISFYNGIIAIISFHSLEDRIIKNFFLLISSIINNINNNINNFKKKILFLKKKVLLKIKPNNKNILLNKKCRSSILRIFSFFLNK